MFRSSVRSIIALLVFLATSHHRELAAQSASSPPASSTPAALGYSYQGTARWQLDSQGKPVLEPSRNAMVKLSAPVPQPTKRRWSPPVVPARPRLHSAFDPQLSAEAAGSNEGPQVLAPQRSTHADSYHAPIAEPAEESGEAAEPSLTEAAWGKLGSAAEAVVGGWNWFALEVNESFNSSRGHGESLARRRGWSGCGKRNWRRRE